MKKSFKKQATFKKKERPKKNAAKKTAQKTATKGK
jgi:hypothetical protein